MDATRSLITIDDDSPPQAKRTRYSLQYNPPSQQWINNFCDLWDFTAGLVNFIIFYLIYCRLGSSPFHYADTHEFMSDSEPKSFQDVDADGNCGYRSISRGLTGMEDHHEVMRFDIQENTEISLDLDLQGTSGFSWWSMFSFHVYYCNFFLEIYGHTAKNLRDHINLAKSPAKHPLDKLRWASNIDLLRY